MTHEPIKPILPPDVTEMTTIREWAQYLRKLADMYETFRKDVSPNNPAGHQRLIGNIEMTLFIADLFQLQVQRSDTAILDVVGPMLSDLVRPYGEAFVAVNNTNVKLAELNGVQLPTLEQVMGTDGTEAD